MVGDVIGGAAEWFFEPRELDELSQTCRLAHGLCDDVRVLGGGSNLLIADEGVRAAIISMRRFEPYLLERCGSTVIRASAGVRLGRLLKRCALWGLSGLECLVGIPGTVGGAIAMNAGGAAGTIGSRVTALELMGPEGTIRREPGNRIEWAYRSTNLGKAIAVYAEIELQEAPVARVRAAMDDLMRRKRATQPLSMASAGCFFRNPRGDSAGRLLDGAGLKGSRRGGAAVSRKHANFLVNRGGATAQDVLELVRIVREAVRQRFQVELENEVHYWA